MANVAYGGDFESMGEPERPGYDPLQGFVTRIVDRYAAGDQSVEFKLNTRLMHFTGLHVGLAKFGLLGDPFEPPVSLTDTPQFCEYQNDPEPVRHGAGDKLAIFSPTLPRRVDCAWLRVISAPEQRIEYRFEYRAPFDKTSQIVFNQFFGIVGMGDTRAYWRIVDCEHQQLDTGQSLTVFRDDPEELPTPDAPDTLVRFCMLAQQAIDYVATRS